jgi:hypothetical protein
MNNRRRQAACVVFATGTTIETPGAVQQWRCSGRLKVPATLLRR